MQASMSSSTVYGAVIMYRVCVCCWCMSIGIKVLCQLLLGSRNVHRQLLRHGNELQYRSAFQSSNLIGWVRVY